jgi:hypothetical protein
VLETERPQIVQPENVVRMRMGIEHRIDMIDPLTQGLHTKVRARVDHHPVSFPGNRDRRPCAPVARIRGGAHPAAAAQRRHTH